MNWTITHLHIYTFTHLHIMQNVIKIWLDICLDIHERTIAIGGV